jgi:uncharacterized protein
VMGDHRPAAVARASGFGMVSSSCSYAATAMAKSLFQKGADFFAAMVFMFASTNLVVELGLVLIVLMGWQFAAAEFVGGPIMIVLLVALGGLFISKALIDEARRRAQGGTGEHQHGSDGSHDGGDTLVRRPWRERLRSKAGWSDAASYTMSDLSMLRRELVIGYVIAGLLAALVPMEVWNDVFLRGHGFWTTLENVIVGPLIACITFVCSVGNVPMAAALWHGGISFGGVISFIFADLIALPLLLIYRKFYGGKVALRLFALFWLVMAAAGLIVELLFSALGLVPTERPEQVVHTGFQWNYTTYLNIVFLVVFGVLMWLAHNRRRLGGGEEHATDPVCGMQIERAAAPATAAWAGTRHWFCSDQCRDRFLASPEDYGDGAAPAAADAHR